MRTIRKLLDKKGHDVWSLPPDASVFEAIELMAEKGIGALVVLEGEVPVGIVSERDYARKVILKGRSSKNTQVRDIMTADVIYAGIDETVEECMARMTNERIRHLPIKDGERLVGVVSIGDLVKAIISDQRFIIKQLEDYISG